MSAARWFGLIVVTALATVLLFAPGSWSSPWQNKAEEIAAATHTRTVLSRVYTVDRKYRSMEGPFGTQEVRLAEFEPPELLWITGYEALMVSPGGDPTAQEFMCHSNLDIDVAAHKARLGANPSFSTRLFTLSQGQLAVRFPAGFGIPVLSDETLDLTTQVLNHNVEGQSFEIRHKVSLQYVRDRDLSGPMQALFPVGAYGLALLEGEEAYFGVTRPDEETQGPGCLVGENASDHEYKDGLGRKFSGHWVVPPGRQLNRTLVTHLMRLPYDTTIHYIAVHLHPFAESLELRDLSAGETVFMSRASNFEGRVGLSRVDYLASEEGIEVYKNHEYELVSVYDNTSGEPQDSMAVMYIYLRDRSFDKRRLSPPANRGDAPGLF